MTVTKSVSGVTNSNVQDSSSIILTSSAPASITSVSASARPLKLPSADLISVSVNPWKDSVSESSSTAARPLKLLRADHISVSVNPWKDSESVSSRDSPDTGIWLLLISFHLAMAHWMMSCFSLAIMTLMARFTSLSNLTLCSLAMWSWNLVLLLFLYLMNPQHKRRDKYFTLWSLIIGCRNRIFLYL